MVASGDAGSTAWRPCGGPASDAGDPGPSPQPASSTAQRSPAAKEPERGRIRCRMNAPGSRLNEESRTDRPDRVGFGYTPDEPEQGEVGIRAGMAQRDGHLEKRADPLLVLGNGSGGKAGEELFPAQTALVVPETDPGEAGDGHREAGGSVVRAEVQPVERAEAKRGRRVPRSCPAAGGADPYSRADVLPFEGTVHRPEDSGSFIRFIGDHTGRARHPYSVPGPHLGSATKGVVFASLGIRPAVAGHSAHECEHPRSGAQSQTNPAQRGALDFQRYHLPEQQKQRSVEEARGHVIPG